MCTAVCYHTKNHYFGRNLDLEFSYNETVTIVPRNYAFNFRQIDALPSHHALIGMAYVVDNYPLYYDAINEKGLGMAALNFVKNADYKPIAADKDNLASFEFIPYILGQAATLAEARALLDRVNLAAIDFSDQLPASQLHWMISDGEKSLVVESVKDGLKVYDNPVGVLTNNPPFDQQLFSLNNYRALSPYQPDNHFSSQIDLELYSRGMGSLGLPGDMSSNSRFVKAAFTRLNSLCPDPSESASISQFFHILASVEQPNGLTHIKDDQFEYTIYSSCGNLEEGIYYYTTYENSQITGVNLHHEDLDGTELVNYPLVHGQQIAMTN